MRLGLIGLGRIGAFHARTLADLPVVDSLVVTDAVPAVTAAVAAAVGAEPTDSPGKLLAAGVDGVLIAAATLPMGRLGQVDEIAEFVVFLLSDRSGVVTGSVLDWDQNVFGGLD